MIFSSLSLFVYLLFFFDLMMNPSLVFFVFLMSFFLVLCPLIALISAIIGLVRVRQTTGLSDALPRKRINIAYASLVLALLASTPFVAWLIDVSRPSTHRYDNDDYHKASGSGWLR